MVSCLRRWTSREWIDRHVTLGRVNTWLVTAKSYVSVRPFSSRQW